MPIPTPPNKELFKVTPPKPVVKPKAKTPRGPSKSAQKMSKDIRELTEAMKLDKNLYQLPTEPQVDTIAIEHILPKTNSLKKIPFTPPEHLSQSPFRDNEKMRKLQQELKKETDPKKPVRRAPRRKPATSNKQGEI